MSVKVRLRRMGNRNRSFYRIVVADSRTSTNGRTIENLGWYNPQQDGINFKLDLERVAYWQQNGAQFSNTVNSLVKQARSLPPEAMAPPAPAESPAAEPAAAEPAPAEPPGAASGTEASEGDEPPPAAASPSEEPPPPAE